MSAVSNKLLARFRAYPLTRGEISGALADLGILVPLEAGLIAVNGLSPTATLLGVGIAYILAGLYFRIPMPVQPLKAFAAIAIAQALSPSVIAAGALAMSVILLLLAATGLMDLLNRAVPQAVVKGIQFGLGLLLMKSAYDMIVTRPFFLSGEQAQAHIWGATIPAGILVGIVGTLALLLLLKSRVQPASAIVIGAGVLTGIALGALGRAGPISLGPAEMRFAMPPSGDFWTALVLLVIPQLPLTLANSVIATTDTARAYFGERARRVTPRRLGISIALGNLWAGLAGGLPVCHGSGGLTAHYRLGARTPAASLFIGGLLLALALLLGRAALQIRTLIPVSVFGVLLLYVGAQHLALGFKVGRKADLAYVFIVGAASMAFGGNLAVGAGAGLAAYTLVKVAGRAGNARRHARKLEAGSEPPATGL